MTQAKETENPYANFLALVNHDTTVEKLDQIIDELLTPKDRQFLGENPVVKTRDGILCLSVVASDPNWFEKTHYEILLKGKTEPHEVNRLLEICEEIGITKQTSPGKFIIDSDTHDMLKRIADS